jgi:hypothetical protein
MLIPNVASLALILNPPLFYFGRSDERRPVMVGRRIK